MPNSSKSPIAEFANFRFVRKADGSLAELTSDRRGERTFLVLDCLRYRLAKLHIFEGLAASDDEADREIEFNAQMTALARLKHPVMTPVLTHGRDDTELFYVESFVDGEALGDYLRRTGGMPESTAIQLMLDLLEALIVSAPRPAALDNFELGHLYVSSKSDGGLRLHFCDYAGWHLPAATEPAALVSRLVLGLYSLMGGFLFRNAPGHLFGHEARHASPEIRSLITATLEESESDDRIRTLTGFASALRQLLNQHDQAVAEITPPHRFLYQWLTEGQGTESINPGSEFQKHRRDSSDAETEIYRFEAATDRASLHGRIRFQLFPNWDSIPREGWLVQHHTALRRGCRSLPNQLGVAAIEAHGRCLLIGEEQVKGITLETLIQTHGLLKLPHALALARKIASALDAMEKTAGAAPVWWLPMRNIYVVTGDENPASVDVLMQKHGANVWQHFPVRLRLHQTAPDLIDGLDFPESIMDFINQGGKQGQPGRRATVILPILWDLLTGEKLKWDRPLESADSLPQKIVAFLEDIRLQLSSDPRNLQMPLIQALDHLVSEEAENSEDHREVEAAFGEGMVSEPVTLFETPVTSASTFTVDVEEQNSSSTIGDDPGEIATSIPGPPRYRSPRTTPYPKSTVPLEEIESLGTIEDPSYYTALGNTEIATTSASAKSPLNLAPFSAHQRPTIIETAPEPRETSETTAPAEPAAEEPKKNRRRLFFGRFQTTEAKTEIPAPAAEEPTEATDIREEDVELLIAPPPVGESELITASPEQAESEEESHPDWVMGLLCAQETEKPKVEASDEEGPMSFFSFLEKNSVPAEKSEAMRFATDTASETALEEEVLKEDPKPAATETTEESSTPTFSVPTRVAKAKPTAPQSSESWLKGASNLVGLVALIWGVTYLLVAFAGSVERQTLAETFTPLVRTDYLKQADPTDAILNDDPSAAIVVTSENAAKIAATSEDDPVAAAALADYYLPVDKTLGLIWLNRSAELGHARHQRQLGLLLSENPEYLPTAVEWLKHAANQGDVEGQLYYGTALMQGRGVAPDPHGALIQIRRAADTGDGRALDLLGTCFAEGIGCEPNQETAFQLFQQAVAAKNFHACYNLAVRHAKGIGTKRDEKRAAEIFLIGAKLGDPECMHAYGRCLESGFGIPEDFKAAVIWMRQAADLGQQDALAWCLRQGVAVEVARN